MKKKVLFCILVALLCICNFRLTAPVDPIDVKEVNFIPQGAYEQICLKYEGVTDEEICRIYAENKAYWDEIDRKMCTD